ncbi:TPA: DNA-binding protein [Klebsiella pneumoniae]
MSILIRGKFLGARTREFTNSQGNYSFYEIGIENSRPDGWGGSQSVQTAIRVPKKLIDSGILNRVSSLQGKNVEIPVWVDAYVGKNGAAINFFLKAIKSQKLNRTMIMDPAISFLCKVFLAMFAVAAVIKYYLLPVIS